jgi:monoamine oxidase
MVESSREIQNSYDVIVLGAGFTGLIAARDIAQLTPSSSILIVEARDRIGGRTWTAQHGGAEYEMGGTWVGLQIPSLTGHFINEKSSCIGLNRTHTRNCVVMV